MLTITNGVLLFNFIIFPKYDNPYNTEKRKTTFKEGHEPALTVQTTLQSTTQTTPTTPTIQTTPQTSETHPNDVVMEINIIATTTEEELNWFDRFIQDKTLYNFAGSKSLGFDMYLASMLGFVFPHGFFMDLLFSLGSKLDKTLYIIAMSLFTFTTLFCLIFPLVLSILVNTKLTKIKAFYNHADACSVALLANGIYVLISGSIITIMFFVPRGSNIDTTLWYNAAYYNYMLTKTILFIFLLSFCLIALIVSCVNVKKESCLKCCFGCKDKLKDVKKETDLETDGYDKNTVV